MGRFPASVADVGKLILDRPRGEQARTAVIRKTHPEVDSVFSAQIESLTTGSGNGSVLLNLSAEGVAAVLREVDGVLRVDVETSWVSLMRLTAELDTITQQQGEPPQPKTTRLQYLLCGKVGATADSFNVNTHDVQRSRSVRSALDACGGREQFNASQCKQSKPQRQTL